MLFLKMKQQSSDEQSRAAKISFSVECPKESNKKEIHFLKKGVGKSNPRFEFDLAFMSKAFFSIWLFI